MFVKMAAQGRPFSFQGVSSAPLSGPFTDDQSPAGWGLRTNVRVQVRAALPVSCASSVAEARVLTLIAICVTLGGLFLSNLLTVQTLPKDPEVVTGAHSYINEGAALFCGTRFCSHDTQPYE